MDVESHRRPDVTSQAGAQGLFQLMPSTQQDYGVTDPFDPGQNVPAGMQYLRDLKRRYKNNMPLVYAAWNAGPGTVDRLGGRVPNYKETHFLIGKVLPGWQPGTLASSMPQGPTGAPVDLNALADEFLGNVPRPSPPSAVTPPATPVLPGQPPPPVPAGEVPGQPAPPPEAPARWPTPTQRRYVPGQPVEPYPVPGQGEVQGPPVPLAPDFGLPGIPWEQPTPGGFASDLGTDLMLGGRVGVEGLAKQIQNLGMLRRKFQAAVDPLGRAPLDENALPALIERAAGRLADMVRVDPSLLKDRDRFDQQLFQAIGQVAPQVAELLVLQKLGVPGTPALVGTTMLSEADKGVVAAAWAGIKALALGKVQQFLSPLPGLLRVPATAFTFALPTWLTTKDPTQTKVQGILGGLLSLFGGRAAPRGGVATVLPPEPAPTPTPAPAPPPSPVPVPPTGLPGQVQGPANISTTGAPATGLQRPAPLPGEPPGLPLPPAVAGPAANRPAGATPATSLSRPLPTPQVPFVETPTGQGISRPGPGHPLTTNFVRRAQQAGVVEDIATRTQQGQTPDDIAAALVQGERISDLTPAGVRVLVDDVQAWLGGTAPQVTTPPRPVETTTTPAPAPTPPPARPTVYEEVAARLPDEPAPVQRQIADALTQARDLGVVDTIMQWQKDKMTRIQIAHSLRQEGHLPGMNERQARELVGRVQTFLAALPPPGELSPEQQAMVDTALKQQPTAEQQALETQILGEAHTPTETAPTVETPIGTNVATASTPPQPEGPQRPSTVTPAETTLTPEQRTYGYQRPADVAMRDLVPPSAATPPAETPVPTAPQAEAPEVVWPPTELLQPRWDGLPWDVYRLREDMRIFERDYGGELPTHMVGPRVGPRVAKTLLERLGEVQQQFGTSPDANVQEALRYMVSRAHRIAQRYQLPPPGEGGAAVTPVQPSPPTPPTPTVTVPAPTVPSVPQEISTLLTRAGLRVEPTLEALRELHDQHPGSRTVLREYLEQQGMPPAGSPGSADTTRVVDLLYNQLAQGEAPAVPPVTPEVTPPKPPTPVEPPPKVPPPQPDDVITKAGELFATKENADFALKNNKKVNPDTYEVVEDPPGSWVIRRKGQMQTPSVRPTTEAEPSVELSPLEDVDGVSQATVEARAAVRAFTARWQDALQLPEPQQTASLHRLWQDIDVLSSSQSMRDADPSVMQQFARLYDDIAARLRQRETSTTPSSPERPSGEKPADFPPKVPEPVTTPEAPGVTSALPQGPMDVRVARQVVEEAFEREQTATDTWVKALADQRLAEQSTRDLTDQEIQQLNNRVKQTRTDLEQATRARMAAETALTAAEEGRAPTPPAPLPDYAAGIPAGAQVPEEETARQQGSVEEPAAPYGVEAETAPYGVTETPTTSEERQRMIRTARAGGAIGREPVVYRVAAPRLAHTEAILDYGAGVTAAQTQRLREQGFTNVTATDLPEAVVRNPAMLSTLAPGQTFATVLASNVLNVQPHQAALVATLADIASRVAPDGRAILNYPKEPRRLPALTATHLETLLGQFFGQQIRIGGTSAEPVWEVSVPRRNPTGAESPTAPYGAAEPEPAPAYAPPFFSVVRQTIATKMPGRAKPAEVEALLKKTPGIKADELKWLGLVPWLQTQGGQVTKGQVLDFLDANQVQVQVQVLGVSKPITWVERPGRGAFGVPKSSWVARIGTDVNPDYLIYQTPTGRYMVVTPAGPSESYPTLAEAQETNAGFITRAGLAARRTQHATYQEPGAERGSYREVLFTLPAGTPGAPPEPFVASPEHFTQPNIVAHIRYNDRTDADGRRVLFLEEVQSDWNKRGRKEGFGSALAHVTADDIVIEPNPPRESWTVTLRDGTYITSLPWRDVPTVNEARQGILRVFRESPDLFSSDAVPPAPFVTSGDWFHLPLKWALRHAAEQGYDGVAWTTGRMQQERYDLRKVADDLVYVPGTGKVLAVKDGEVIFGPEAITPETLPNVVGKENADKLLASPRQNHPRYGPGVHVLSGAQFATGGEWATKLYDRMIPQFLNKYGKQWGARVGETAFMPAVGRYEILDAEGHSYGTYPDRTIAQREMRLYEQMAPNASFTVVNLTEPSHRVSFLPITDTMRQSVLTQGQPLFAPGAPYAQRPGTPPEAADSAQKSLDALDAARRAPLRSASGAVERVPPAPLPGQPGPLGTRLLGKAIASEAYIASLRQTGAAAFVGQLAPTAHDIAVLAQGVRDPQMERLFWIFMKGNQAVDVVVVSSRLPGSSEMFPTGDKPGLSREQHIQLLQRQMRQSGADTYILVHNHPAGDPKPSASADVPLTQAIARDMPGFAAHVVIDSGKYSVITADGKWTMHDLDTTKLWAATGGRDPLLQAAVAEVPHPLNGVQIYGGDSLATLAAQVNIPAGYVLAFYRSGTGQVRGIELVPVSLFRDPNMRRLLGAHLQLRKRAMGSPEVLTYYDGTDPAVLSEVYDTAGSFYETGMIRDHYTRALGDAASLARSFPKVYRRFPPPPPLGYELERRKAG